MLNRIARLALDAPRRVLAAAVLVMLGAAAFGLSVGASLSAGGGLDPGADSSKAATLLAEEFEQGATSMVFTVTSADGALGPSASRVGRDIAATLRDSPDVAAVQSAWTVPRAAAAAYLGSDGRTGLVVASVSGGATDAQLAAERLADAVGFDRDGVSVRAGGEAIVNRQVNQQTQRDLLVMEVVALPLSFLVLIWVFGGVVSAALPVLVGTFAILGSMAALRAVALFTDVSIFALNLSVAMGLALAIDYTLLILSRYRDELSEGGTSAAALAATMSTAGRTVLFSALTVALSMATLVLFPQYFLKSFAYAGVAVVALAACAAIVVTPAAIVVLGPRLDALDVRSAVRRRLHGQPTRSPHVEDRFWYRWTSFVMRRAVPLGLTVVVLLLLLGAPFRDARWGFADDRVLPESASARQVGDVLRSQFPATATPPVTVVLPDAAGVRPAQLDRYAAALSRVADVRSVSAPGGTFAAGERVGPASAPTGFADGRAFLTVTTTAPLYTAASTDQLDRLHEVPPPLDRPAWLTGPAQSNRDSVHAIAVRLPVVLVTIVLITLILVFLLTGSVVLPVKAVLTSALSLTATFGAMVWIFQEGHLGGLGTTATGTLGVQLPVLLFCIAFGLSMDYEVFLISRIRECWLASHRGWGAAEVSVARGVAYTGRVVTAAALIMAIAFAALMAAQVSLMRLFGFGLAVAVLVDATLVRMVLVPAFMRMLGDTAWWAPRPLARLHRRIGLHEGTPSWDR